MLGLAARSGAQPVQAFVSGYQFALVVAAVIIAIGVPLSLYALRLRRPEPAVSPFPAAAGLEEPVPAPAVVG